ncbi:hypothetical protein F5878DRAFT_722369 [Lentinula raphanica]|uniref:Uncharacterized protein n=1 Tax=Lentinula raphanica TaxID=153919 RepID=A0AA38UIA2_9AGAR|nr:hypothetical protein F5878DRAFT_722369 [Lentinula raphanica]
MNKSPSERFLLSNVENHNNGQRGMKISDDIPSDESVRRHCEILQNELEELHDEGYLFQPEVHSEDDCIQLTNSLNAKIQEISLSIVRACCSSAGTPSSLERINISAQDLSQIQTIRSGDTMRYKYIIRCAIQATLAALCDRVVSTWSFDKEENEVLSNIYVSLRSQFDNPALTGTWRSLTRSQSKIAEYHRLKPAAIRSFVSETAKVLVLSRGISWDLNDAQGIIQDYFQGEFADLYSYCFRLDRITGESILSFDTEVYLPEPGQLYDHTIMYDMDTSTRSKDGSSSAPKIAFSCRLGLLKVVKKESNDDFDISGRKEIEEEEILLKAGVQPASLISDFGRAISP